MIKWAKVLSFLFSLALGAHCAQAAVATPAPTPPSQVILLEPRETDRPVLSRSYYVSRERKPFKKEPVLSKDGVIRGSLDVGQDATNRLAFIWDRSHGKLYLDLNRNEDLTDDPAGVFQAEGKGDSQTFKGIRTALKTASGVHSFLLDVSLTGYGNELMTFGNVNLRSYWQGKLTWQGQDYEIGLIEDTREGWGGDEASQGPFLVLRPWAARAQPLELPTGTADALRLPTRLFWRNRAMRLTPRFDTAAGQERCQLELREEQPSLGELKVTGSMVHRLVLQNDRGYTVVLEAPDSSVKIPVGSYRAKSIWIKQGEATACQRTGRSLTISEKSPTVFLAGGPLTNSVTAKRRGKYLVLDYSLIGADGGAYQLSKDDPLHPPAFTIFHNGKKVATGQFAFG
jgi:hypothetical protein